MMILFGYRFEEQEAPGSRSFFTEIIASISDIKFGREGRYILSRDYMTLKVRFFFLLLNKLCASTKLLLTCHLLSVCFCIHTPWSGVLFGMPGKKSMQTTCFFVCYKELTWKSELQMICRMGKPKMEVT